MILGTSSHSIDSEYKLTKTKSDLANKSLNVFKYDLTIVDLFLVRVI